MLFLWGKRAGLLGKTQSNISIPKAIQTTRSESDHQTQSQLPSNNEVYLLATGQYRYGLTLVYTFSFTSAKVSHTISWVSCGSLGYIIQLNHYINPNSILYLYRMIWCQNAVTVIKRRFEFTPLSSIFAPSQVSCQNGKYFRAETGSFQSIE